jgi:hypothetical protein
MSDRPEFMKYFKLLVWVLLAAGPAKGQRSALPPGIWSIGTAGNIHPVHAADSGRYRNIRLENALVMVNLYPGFAVVKGEYRFRNLTDSTVILPVGYTSSGHFPLQHVGQGIFNSEPVLNILCEGRPVQTRPDTLMPDVAKDPYAPYVAISQHVWEQRFPADTTLSITVKLITRNHLSRLVKGERSAGGNAFGYIMDDARPWGGTIGIAQVLVKFNEGIFLTDMKGILPDSTAIGNMGLLRFSHLDLEPRDSDNILLWYEGMPPDFKFEKRVVPFRDTLLRMMDDFPVEKFNDPGAERISRMNFYAPGSTLDSSGILYFVMFVTPWLILLAFIIYLLKGRKEKRDQADEAMQDMNDQN